MPDTPPNPCTECGHHPRVCLYLQWRATRDLGGGTGARFQCNGIDGKIWALAPGSWRWRLRGPRAAGRRPERAAGTAGTRLQAMRALADAIRAHGLLGMPTTAELMTAMILTRLRGLGTVGPARVPKTKA